jgi:hypothetical protein
LDQIGHLSTNQAVREAGTTHHTRKASVETIAGGSIALGRIPIVVAFLALAAWVLSR